MKAKLRQLKAAAYLWGARYFMFWAGLTLRRWDPLVIAVTGSVGKTTLLHILEAQFGAKARYSYNANSAYGIAFDLVGLSGVTGSRLKWLLLAFAVPVKSLLVKHRPKIYVVEIDADRPNEAGEVARWLKPEVTLWVSLSRSHAVNFQRQAEERRIETIDLITEAFAEVPAATSEVVLIDGLSQAMRQATREIRAEVVPVGRRVNNYQVSKNSSKFSFNEGTFIFAQPMPEEVQLQLAFVLELMDRLGKPVKFDLTHISHPPGRSTYLQGIRGLDIIDSSYNAHMESMESILSMFARIRAEHKWLVIGDIIEQGKHQADENAQLALLLGGQKVDKIILVGRRTNQEIYPVLQPELGTRVISFLEPRQALEYLQRELLGEELVLFKGSQFLEGIIKHLLANPLDEELLCRRGKNAQKERQLRGVG